MGVPGRCFAFARSAAASTTCSSPLGEADSPTPIVDWFAFDWGEWFSARQQRLSALAPPTPNARPDHSGVQEELLLNSDKIRHMNEALNAGRYSGVLGTYFSLPPTLQAERGCLRMRVAAAAMVDEAAYRSALGDFLGRFGGSVHTDLTAVDGHLLLGNPQASFTSIDRLDALLQDPLLGLLRAGVFGLTARRDLAKAELEKVIVGAPSDVEAYWSLVGLALEDKQFAEVAKWLTALRKLGVEFQDLKSLTRYEAFIASPEGKQWLSESPLRGTK
jgi:hypothetical protein